jgi:DNA-binding transcriptional regulator YiaG
MTDAAAAAPERKKAQVALLCSPPAPDAIRAARAKAGHSQKAAGLAIGVPSYRTWQDWERGVAAMPPAPWAMYLLATGQHPTAVVRSRP